MSQALSNLLALLDLEKIEEGLFRGQSEDLGLRQVFGGQVVGQALYAAKETVPVERLVHSFHSYFLRPGDSQKPIVYDVEVLRDGNSFSARRVAAIQNGKPIFYMTASFQAPEHGYEHQKAMPPAPSPDGLHSETDIARKLAHLLPPQVKDKFLCDKPLEIRPVEFHNPMKGHIAEPVRQVWLRANGAVPDDLRIHQYLLAMPRTLISCRWRCSRTASASLSLACRSPLSTTQCGSTGRLISMNGCYTALKAPRPPAPVASSAASSTLRMERWWLQRSRKG